MSSLFSSVLSYAGALLPVVLLVGLLWVTATAPDSEASHPTRKQRVPGGWDSHDDEHLLFPSPSPSRPPPRLVSLPPFRPRPRSHSRSHSRSRRSSVVRTVSSAFTSLVSFAQPRSIPSTSQFITCPSPLLSPHLSHLSSSHPRKKRPSARASSTGVSRTSTLSQTYSHLTSLQYRSSLSDEAVSKTSRKGLLTIEPVDNGLYGKWPLSHAIDQSAKALAAPGRKNSQPAAERAE